MFERFDEDGRQVVVLAQGESRRLRHNHIGSEHLLLGLLRVPGIAAQVLESFGLTLSGVRDQIVQLVAAGDEEPSGQIPFTPRAKKVLELSLREAQRLGHDQIDTEHLLLGLLRENEGVAIRVLLAFDVSTEAVREAVLGLVRGPDPPGRVRGAPVARALGEAPQLEVGFRVTPDSQARRLLMAASARALADGRTEFGIRDLMAAARADERAVGLLDELATDEP